MSRRDDVIAEATALLRESEPDSLTSVNVAARLGVTQSAIYRHVRDMDELTTLASDAVIAELGAVMIEAFTSPDTTWGTGDDIARFADRLVGLIAEHEQAFTLIDRWRYETSELGDGIRSLLQTGRTLVAAELERACRQDFDIEVEFGDAAHAAQLAHAQLIIDDVIVVARMVPGTDRNGRPELARVLSLRLFAGWCGYVLDMTERLGVPTPILGGPALSAPPCSTP